MEVALPSRLTLRRPPIHQLLRSSRPIVLGRQSALGSGNLLAKRLPLKLSLMMWWCITVRLRQPHWSHPPGRSTIPHRPTAGMQSLMQRGINYMLMTPQAIRFRSGIQPLRSAVPQVQAPARWLRPQRWEAHASGGSRRITLRVWVPGAPRCHLRFHHLLQPRWSHPRERSPQPHRPILGMLFPIQLGIAYLLMTLRAIRSSSGTRLRLSAVPLAQRPALWPPRQYLP